MAIKLIAPLPSPWTLGEDTLWVCHRMTQALRRLFWSHCLASVEWHPCSELSLVVLLESPVFPVSSVDQTLSWLLERWWWLSSCHREVVLCNTCSFLHQLDWLDDETVFPIKSSSYRSCLPGNFCAASPQIIVSKSFNVQRSDSVYNKGNIIKAVCDYLTVHTIKLPLLWSYRFLMVWFLLVACLCLRLQYCLQ